MMWFTRKKKAKNINFELTEEGFTSMFKIVKNGIYIITNETVKYDFGHEPEHFEEICEQLFGQWMEKCEDYANDKDTEILN